MKITKIWFDADYIYGKDENEKEYKQSLLWYPKLREASDEERSQYVFGLGGIHWRNLDEDISFINPTLLRNYINGFKKPSKEREQEILSAIHQLGEEMIAA